jgi:flagellar basal body L-ring protein FlgH
MKYNNECGGSDSNSSSSSSSNSNDNNLEAPFSAMINTVIPTGHDVIPVETSLFIAVDLVLS